MKLYAITYTDGSTSFQVAQMTSSQVITHLFLPLSKWEWHHRTAPKQVRHCCGILYIQIMYNQIPSLSEQCGLSWPTDLNSGMERAWIELEGIEAIVKTASKAKFFIEFYSSCLEGIVSHQNHILLKGLCGTVAEIHLSSCFTETRRSSENDSQSCDVPGFLKQAWSFKQLPKVRGSVCSFGDVWKHSMLF